MTHCKGEHTFLVVGIQPSLPGMLHEDQELIVCRFCGWGEYRAVSTKTGDEDQNKTQDQD